MLIPSIDLMGGKIVQLVQGKRKALEFDDFEEWVARFSKYPLVQLIDLDAAMGTGNNVKLVMELARQLPCQVGGGIRSVEAAQAALAAGAQRIIFGSALFSDGKVNQDFAERMVSAVGSGVDWRNLIAHLHWAQSEMACWFCDAVRYRSVAAG